MPHVAVPGPFEVNLDDDGELRIAHYNFLASFHAVRLTGCKVVCLGKTNFGYSRSPANLENNPDYTYQGDETKGYVMFKEFDFERNTTILNFLLGAIQPTFQVFI